MRGKTFTQQDLTLGTVIMQQMPLQAMTTAEKQGLIDNKKLVEALVSLAFTKSGELTEALDRAREFKVWSSTDLMNDPFADDQYYDSVELWYKIRFEGLNPFITRQLRFLACEDKKRSADPYERIEEGDETNEVDFEDLSHTFTFRDMIEGSVCEWLAVLINALVDNYTSIEVIDFLMSDDPPSDDNDFEALFLIVTTTGGIEFY